MAVVAVQDRNVAEESLFLREQTIQQPALQRFLAEVSKNAPPGLAAPSVQRRALRVGARRYDPNAPPSLCSPAHRAWQTNCVLGVLASYLRSLPVVADVAEQRDDGKSVRFLATVRGESAAYCGSVVAGAQHALLQAALHSQSVYVTGHARNPFTPLGVHRCGFRAQLCVADERMCMDAVDYGRCNRWCPRTECRRKHPREGHLTEVVLEVQEAARGGP